MTSQGTAHGRFARAIANRNLRGAETAARELGWLSLEDALQLCVLYAATDRARYERAAVRWLERLLAERQPSLEDVGLAIGALAELGNGKSAVGTFTLRRLARRRWRPPSPPKQPPPEIHPRRPR
jgi:hypothetical protein